MADFIFKISPNIVLGSYTSARLGQFSKEWGSKFMVIVDPLLKQLGSIDTIIQSLNDRKIDFFTFDELPENADTEVVKEALSLAREAHVHGVIAIGSSKTINIAKAVCSLYHESHDLYDFVDGATPSTAALPLICLPSTIREPFIFSDKAPLIDARSSRIRLLKTPSALCKLVLFDPNLTLTLTENQTAAMAIETLCIATEAYLSPKASFFSDMVVEKAVELLGYGLDGSRSLTITTPQEVLLAQGGCMASLGATSSSIGASVLIAMCVNSRYKISRALTTEILFPYVIEDAAKYKSDRLAKLSRILKACPLDAKNDEAVSAFTEYVRQHIAKVSLPSRLKDLGLTIEQFSLAAEDAGELDLINTLPRSMSADDLFDLIKVAY